MTKEEFLNKLDDLLKEYCRNNSDYQNIHEARNIMRIKTREVKEGVRVAIDTYLFRKEG